MSYRKIDPKLKTKWLKALRSGKFVQGQGALRNSNGHCCLGVLCELQGRLAKVDDDGEVISKAKVATIDYDITNSDVKAPKLRGGQLIHPESCWVLPTWVDRKAQSRLAEMNDAGRSFDNIADWIKENL